MRGLLIYAIHTLLFLIAFMFIFQSEAAYKITFERQAESPRIVSHFTAAAGAHYPFRENMYRALQLPDRKIIALSIGRVGKQQSMEGRYSSDNGASWSDPQDLFQWSKAEGAYGLFNALVDNTGEIHIWALCDGNSGVLFPRVEEGIPTRPEQVLDVWYVRSRNGRVQWDSPKRIWSGRSGDLLSAIQLRSGRLLIPITIQTSQSWKNRGGGFPDFTYVGNSEVSALYSDDDGQTWRESPDRLTVEVPDSSTFGAAEPAVLELKDGRVWMLIRTQRGRFYESFSNDAGAHWSAAQPSKLISSDSPAALLRLKGNTILLFSNACRRYPYAYGGRYVLHVAVSDDEGKTWRGYREAARDPTRNLPPPSRGDYGLAYTFPTLLTNGQVLFSNWVEEGTERNFRLLDPKWIYETRQATDFSKGLDDWSIFGSSGIYLQPDPVRSGAAVLSISKSEKDWPAGAVWNFPMGADGSVEMQLMVRPGFGGALVGLTDHFSVPWDMEDEFSNVFNLPISTDGKMLSARLVSSHWYEIVLTWNIKSRECRVLVDGQLAGVVPDNHRSDGVNYLRLRSVSPQRDKGLLLRAVSADVSAR